MESITVQLLAAGTAQSEDQLTSMVVRGVRPTNLKAEVCKAKCLYTAAQSLLRGIYRPTPVLWLTQRNYASTYRFSSAALLTACPPMSLLK